MLRLARAALLAALLGLPHSPVLAQVVNDGLEAAQRGEYELAVEIWRPLAEAGDARAQNYMGLMYDNGWGVPQDYGVAHDWFARAAERGYANAQYHLAFAYQNGRGTQRSQDEAFKWYSRAAAQGDGGAQYNLGRMYQHGLAVPRDVIEAYKWLAIAAMERSPFTPLAARDRDLLARKMTDEQIEEAEERVENWRPG